MIPTKEDVEIKKGQKFFYLILIFLSIGVVWLIRNLWEEILLAFTTALVLHPYYEYLKQRFKLSSFGANLTVLFSTFLFIFLPLTSIAYMVLRDALSLQARIGENFNFADLDLQALVVTINKYLAMLPFSNYSIDPQQLQTSINNGINFITGFIINNLSGVLGSVTSIILSIIIYFTLLFFLVPHIKRLSVYVRDLSPLHNKIDEQFLGRAKAMIMDMLKGTLVIGMVQSAIAGLTLWTFGVDYVLTLTVVMMVLSLVPIIGTTFIMIPVAFIMMLLGSFWAGLVIILVQTLIIANVDNILRPRLVSEQAKLNPVLVLISVIGGINVMGMLGVIYGPVIMILFVTALETYKRYYR